MTAREAQTESVAVIFDFDHTLAHLGDRVDWDAARADLLAVYEAAGIPAATLATIPDAIALYAAIARSPMLPPDRHEAAQAEARRVLDRHEAAAAEGLVLVAGAMPCARSLAAAGVVLGVVSSNATAVVRGVLDRTGGSGLLGTLVGRDDVRLLKPGPEGLLRCCGALGVPPSRALYVGDLPTDMEAARAAGAIPVGIVGPEATRADLAAAGAVAVVDQLEELASHGAARLWTDLLDR